ncbi:MAG: hypothetical protein EB117_15970 [Betaproteobacteria bacterium]|nr:hypothetical protein [Betaproteobacteria bacterium]
MFLLNGQPLPLDIEFTDADGNRYPATWLRTSTLEEKAAIGITEAPEPERYDDRFYWGVGNPKQLDDLEVTPEEGEAYTQKGLKSNWVAQIKDTAGKLLAQTDWMIIRKVERAVEIPAKVETYRAAVIAEANRLESDILACKDVEELITVIGQQEWPRDRV